LLAALNPCEAERLAPFFEFVRMEADDVLGESGRPPAAATFPLSGVVALNHVMARGATTAVALVGSEGLVGMSLFMTGASTLLRAVVVMPGDAARLPRAAIERERALGGGLQSLALRYIQALTTQMAQTAVCNRHHNVYQQLCRWLLVAFDRTGNGEVHLTHEQIANLLGVRREGVTEAAGRLQKDGIIHYSRGLIRLDDRAGLEQRACECYGVVQQEYRRLLGRQGSLR
jgi:CRP-like cAMP-binding protein